MARSGLKKVVKTVKGKKKTVRRTYWVKSESPKKKGLGPGGMIKRAGLYHRIDQSIGRASPLKKGLIAAGTVAGMLALAGGAVYAGSALRGASRKQAAGSATPGSVGGSTLEGMHRSMGGTPHVDFIDRYKADRERARALHHVPQHLVGSYVHGVAKRADVRAAMHFPYTRAHHKTRSRDSWFDNIRDSSMRLDNVGLGRRT